MQTHSLMQYVHDKRRLKQAARQCMRRKSSPGIDKVSWKLLRVNMAQNLESLRNDILNRKWEPSSLKYVQITQFSGKMLEFGIPNTRDRIVHRLLRNIIEPILDQFAFRDFVSGFRRKRSRLTSVRQAFDYLKTGKNYVINIDIQNVTTGVTIENVIDLLALYISDGNFLSFVRKVLSGLPSPLYPGSGLCPLLINLRLVPIDDMFVKWPVVRFADNYCIFANTFKEATSIFEEAKNIILNYEMKISETKSGILDSPNPEDLFLL